MKDNALFFRAWGWASRLAGRGKKHSLVTPDPGNVLFKIAHPDLYERNPFNVLNLPIDATAKDIRRRREDIEAAFEAGTEAEEFKHFLPLDKHRKPPTRDAVHDAFDALNDPEMRIAYSLFWFWPDPETGQRNYERIYTNYKPIAQWREKALFMKPGTEKTVLCHNLAVFHHLMALDYEQSQDVKVEDFTDAIESLRSSGYSNDDIDAWLGAKETTSLTMSPDEASNEWKEAIRYWNTVSTDAEAWHVLSNIVSILNDPRLDYRFARSLRDQFAFAFDQINVELAIVFAKTGRAADAKRHVEYMKLSQPEADDVEGTFDDAFAGLQRQVEAIVKTAREEVDRNPKSGLAKIDEILERTKEPVQISRIVFEKGATIRESIITTIFGGVRNCMVAYGNETKDWDGCLKRISALKALSENDRQAALVVEDERIIVENKIAKDEEETCWFCKQRYSTYRPRRTQTIHLWGYMRMGVNFGDVTFSKRSIEVSLCQHCLIHDYPERHPSVKKLLDAGWEKGLGPSQDNIFAFYHFGQPKPLVSKENQSNKINPNSSPQNNKQNNPGRGCLFWMIIGMTLWGVLRLVA